MQSSGIERKPEAKGLQYWFLDGPQPVERIALYSEEPLIRIQKFRQVAKLYYLASNAVHAEECRP